MKDLRIIFMGTPDFATGVLQRMVEEGLQVVAVVTVADKPAGRGQKLQESSVKKYALSQQIPVLQPISLRDEAFLAALKEFQADVQVVVAFRMLPKVVWQMPSKGTFNLHASLLPCCSYDFRSWLQPWSSRCSSLYHGVPNWMVY